MKITKINTYLVRPRWCFVEIETDEGLVGYGEPIVEGKGFTMKACVEELGASLIGKNPLMIEDIWNELYRGGFYRGGPILMSAISGIDQALWDIKGKYFNAPVYELLGGKCRDKIEVYSWIGGDKPEEVVFEAKKKFDEGFRAIKMNATHELQYIDTYDKIDDVLARVASIRKNLGNKMRIALDFHGRVHKPMAKILAKKLEEFDLCFIEEPVLCEHMEEFAEIARCCNIPIATGERLFTKYDFRRLLNLGGVDIIQPDLSHAGGITEVRKIASLAEAYDVALAPHCPLGPIALSSCLQIDAVSYNAVIQEQSRSIHYNENKEVDDYLLNPEMYDFVDGYAKFPTKPGLGVLLNKELILKENENPHNWKNPIW